VAVHATYYYIFNSYFPLESAEYSISSPICHNVNLHISRDLRYRQQCRWVALIDTTNVWSCHAVETSRFVEGGSFFAVDSQATG
jgi:hypothetical protein